MIDENLDYSQLHQSRYLLVDPLKAIAASNPLSIMALTDRVGARHIKAMIRPDLSYDSSSCPHLVSLVDLEAVDKQQLIEETVNYALSERLLKKRYICGWLTSTFTLDELTIYCQQCCAEMGREVLQDYCLPFFEPLRMELLYEIDKREALGWLVHRLSGFSHYSLLNIHGQILSFSGADLQRQSECCWQMKQAQKNVFEIYLLLDIWLRICRQNQQQLPAQALLKVEQVIAKLADFNLVNREDRMLLALNWLIINPLLEQFSDISQAINLAYQRPGSLAKAFMSIPPQKWQAWQIKTANRH